MKKLLSLWEDSLRVEAGVSGATVEAYLTDLTDFSTFLSDRYPAVFPGNIQREHFFAYFEALREKNAAENTIARRWTSISLFFRFLVREELIGENPIDGLRRPSFRKPLPEILTPDQVQNLLEAPDPEDQHFLRDRALLEVIYATGARVSEVANLRTSFMDLRRGKFRIVGKGKKMREVFLGEKAVEWCRKYRDGPRKKQVRDQDVPFFFVSQKGGALRRESIWKLFKKYLRRVPEVTNKVSPHVLRHSFATHLLQNGAGLREVQALLGHSSISTTEVYTHLNIEDLRESQQSFLPRDDLSGR